MGGGALSGECCGLESFTRPTATEMTLYRAEVVHVSILVSPQRAFDFLADVNNWKTWAPWVRGARKDSDRIYNALRISPNGAGSELSMVVLHTPPATGEQFEQDVRAVRDDFARIKNVLESTASASRR